MADLFQFPDIPQERDSIPLYRTLLPKDPAADARRRAATFGIRGAVRDTGARVIVSDRRGSLELFRASDSLRWSTMQAASREDALPGDLPEEGEAFRLARDFLRQRKIPVTNARPHNVTVTELSRVTRRQREPATTRVAVHVNYRFALDELPVFGPGAKIQVTLGGRGRPLECYRFWRATRREGERRLVSRDAILALLRRDPMFADLTPDRARVTFRRARLGYFALPPRERQGMLIPAWAFDGTVSTRDLERYDFVRYVVAVDFSADEAKRLGVVLEQPTHLFA